MTVALYPGSFDPVTNGHLDIIHRASKLFDELVVAVAENNQKDGWFSLAQRTRLVEDNTRGLENVRVVTLSGLLAEQARKLSADVVIRGLRAVSDFDYEMMMALMNRKLNPQCETVFLMPSEQYIYLRSSLVREVFSLGGDISDLVPSAVVDAFQKENRRRRDD